MAQPGSGEVLFQGTAKAAASLKGYLKWTGVCLLGVGAGIGLNMLDLGIPPWILFLLWFAGVPGLVWTYLDQVTTKYKVNRRRVETERGVLTKKVDSLELWRVLDVQYEQSLLDRIFGIARIKLIGTDQSDPVLELYGLPGHRALFETLRDAVQDARQTNRPMELVPGQDLHHQGDMHHAAHDLGSN